MYGGGISNRKRKGNVYFPCRKFRSWSWCFLFFDQGRVLGELIGLLLDDRELIMVVDEWFVDSDRLLSFLFGWGRGGSSGQGEIRRMRVDKPRLC